MNGQIRWLFFLLEILDLACKDTVDMFKFWSEKYKANSLLDTIDHSIFALLPCLIGENNLCIFLSWFMTLVAHIMSKKLLGSIRILLVKFHWIETTLHHFECPTRQDYIQPKNILAPACVHYLKRTGIMQISLRDLLWNVRINAAHSNVVVAVVYRGTRGTGWLPTR